MPSGVYTEMYLISRRACFDHSDFMHLLSKIKFLLFFPYGINSVLVSICLITEEILLEDGDRVCQQIF